MSVHDGLIVSTLLRFMVFYGEIEDQGANFVFRFITHHFDESPALPKNLYAMGSTSRSKELKSNIIIASLSHFQRYHEDKYIYFFAALTLGQIVGS